MNRREMLRWTGTAGIAVVAGCINDGQTSDSTPEPDETDDPTDDGTTPTDDGTTTARVETETGAPAEGPVGTVEAFVTAIDEGDRAAVESYLHPESPLDFTEEQLSNAAESAYVVQEPRLVDETDGEATVEFLLDVTVGDDQVESVPQETTLRLVDGEWRVYDLRQNRDSELVPQAAFVTDLTDDTLEITHEAGDAIPAEELAVRGEGIEPVGFWSDIGGETNGEVDGAPAVVAGDSVTVEADDRYEINVVWVSSDADRSATLFSAAGARESVSERPQAPAEVDSYLADVEHYDGTVADAAGVEEVRVLTGDVPDVESSFAFDPPAVRVDPGTTVTWEVVGDSAHSVTHEGGAFDSGLFDGDGTTWSYTFEDEGTYRYYCRPHRGQEMKGAVVVGPLPAAEGSSGGSSGGSAGGSSGGGR